MKWVARITLLAIFLPVGATGQTWTEAGDATTFPFGRPQVTKGPASLTAISGELGSGDSRDAYCIKIAQPSLFMATTDPATDASASAAFDSSLFLFRRDGAPVLANDDTPATVSGLSTLNPATTDGSGFVLDHRNEYVIVVTGSGDLPRDAADQDLFSIDSDVDAIHAPFSAAGAFDTWTSPQPAASGAYDLVLRGTLPCDSGLDAVFVNRGGPSQACPGDGNGSFSACDDPLSGAADADAIATGFLNDDDFLDLVAVVHGAEDKVCLGNGDGTFSCGDLNSDTLPTQAVALGFMDGDQNLDLILGLEDLPHQICLGDGIGGFASCTNVDAAFRDTMDLRLGYVDDDAHLDIVSTEFQKQDRLCLGDGMGGFSCGNLADGLTDSRTAALGFVDGDRHLDVVMAMVGSLRVCLGDGAGAFTCSTAGFGLNYTDIALGYLNGDNHLDLVASTRLPYTDQVCLGDGAGGFTCSRLDSPITATPSQGIDLAFLNDDEHLDVVLAADDLNKVCLGRGNGTFEACNLINDDIDDTGAVVLGEFAATQIFRAGFETGDTSEWTGP